VAASGYVLLPPASRSPAPLPGTRPARATSSRRAPTSRPPRGSMPPQEAGIYSTDLSLNLETNFGKVDKGRRVSEDRAGREGAAGLRGGAQDRSQVRAGDSEPKDARSINKARGDRRLAPQATVSSNRSHRRQFHGFIGRTRDEAEKMHPWASHEAIRWDRGGWREAA
jgi:hypothetical protein